MKTIFKNLTYGLLITMLITSSFTSKANARLVLDIKGKLVEKLVESKSFKAFALNSVTFAMSRYYHQASLTKEQIDAESKLMANYQSRMDLTFPEKLEYAQICGYATWEQLTEKLVSMGASKTKLLSDFPEFGSLDAEAINEVLALAGSKLEMSNLLGDNALLQKCIDTASNEMAKCKRQSKGGVLYGIAAGITIACIGAAIITGFAIAGAITTATAGAGVLAAMAAWAGYLGAVGAVCGILGNTAVGVANAQSNADRAYCQADFNRKLNVCVALHKD